jgi:hypothetical protein
VTQSNDRRCIRRRGLHTLADALPVSSHQPWCDPTQHAGTSCRSTPVMLEFTRQGELPAGCSSAMLQLATVAAAPGEPSTTCALMTLGTAVFELAISHAAALGAGFDSLLLAVTGIGAAATRQAEMAVRMASPAYPDAAGL